MMEFVLKPIVKFYKTMSNSIRLTGRHIIKWKMDSYSLINPYQELNENYNI